MAKHSLDERLLGRLTKNGLIDDLQAAQAEEYAHGKAIPVAKALVLLGFVSETRVQKSVARVSGLEFLELEHFTPRPEAIECIDAASARRYQAVPLGIVEKALVVAVYDPQDIVALDELKVVAGCPVRAILATETAVKAALDTHYASAIGASSDRVRRFSILPPPSDVEDEPADEEPPDEQPVEKPQGAAATTANFASSADVHKLETVMDRTTVHSAGTTIDPQPDRSAPRDSISDVPTLLLDPENRDDLPPPDDTGEAPSEFYPDDEQRADSGFDVFIPGHEDEQKPKDETSEKSVHDMLKALLDAALSRRAEELDLAPPEGRRCQPRLRKNGAWSPAQPYAPRYHEPMIEKIRLLAGVDEKPSGATSDQRFILQGRSGNVAVAALFSETQRGPRCVLRFPENIPLLQRPLRVLGLDRDLEKRLEERLGGKGGCFILLTTDRARTTDQLYASLLLDQAARGRSVISLSLHIERNLPGVTQLHCPTEDDVREGLRHIAMEAPDLAGVASIPTAVTLRDVAAASAGGQAILGALTAADAEIGAGLLDAVGLDPMAMSRDVAAHLHVTALPRLESGFSRPISRTPTNMPEWARDIPVESLREIDPAAAGDDDQPYRSLAWAAEVRIPDSSRPGAMKVVQSREASLRRLAEAGFIDIRDVPD